MNRLAAPGIGPPRASIRIPLARDPARILAWLGVRLVIAEVGIVVGLQTPGAIGIAVTTAGLAVLVYVVLLSLHVLSVRLELRPGEVHLASALVRRRYVLDRGPVTRMRVPPRKGIFGTQLGGFGIEIGLGRAPSQESVQVMRLAPVDSLIVIPSRPVRLAVVPLSERRLLHALGFIAANVEHEAARIEAQDLSERASR